MSLKTRLLRLEEANTVVKQPWHIEALVPEGGMCPHCQALKAMSEEELDAELARLMDIMRVASELK
jgi:hypothetical protein